MELLEAYSIEQIVIFIIMLACSVKAVVDFYDWFRHKADDSYEGRKKKEDRSKQIDEAFEKHSKAFEQLFKRQDELFEKVEKLTDSMDLLMKSDRDDIKSYITEKHHYFCYEQHWIDDYSLDCLEKRYNHYVDEGGNSYIKSLMDEIRHLPKQRPDEQKSE